MNKLERCKKCPTGTMWTDRQDGDKYCVNCGHRPVVIPDWLETDLTVKRGVR